MKPLIAILSLYDEGKDSYWMLPGYVQGLEDAGASPVILPYTACTETLERYAALCDGFLFPGGQDLHPSLYGWSPRTSAGSSAAAGTIWRPPFTPWPGPRASPCWASAGASRWST